MCVQGWRPGASSRKGHVAAWRSAWCRRGQQCGRDLHEGAWLDRVSGQTVRGTRPSLWEERGEQARRRGLTRHVISSEVGRPDLQLQAPSALRVVHAVTERARYDTAPVHVHLAAWLGLGGQNWKVGLWVSPLTPDSTSLLHSPTTTRVTETQTL